MRIKYLSQINKEKISGKTCLLRIDLNVENEKDNFRLEVIAPTIKLLLKQNVRVVLLSHKGRPEKFNKNLSLSSFAPIIAKRVGEITDFVIAYRMDALKKTIAASDAKILLLENLRFFKGEETNDQNFAKILASLGDFYVNDAFPVCHRKNASVSAITKFLPSYAGLRLEEEIKNLDGVMKNYRSPMTFIIGGAKIADKLGVIKNFWHKADYFLLGGRPANTMLVAKGLDVGDSIYDASLVNQMKQFAFSPKLKLPSDFKIKNNQFLDIGPKTINEYTKIINQSQTIIWNGPMGIFETKEFTKGTIAIWKAISVRCQMPDAWRKIIVGGGETITSFKLLKAKSYKLKANIFLSTGGGAMLEYLSGKKLPGIEALKS